MDYFEFKKYVERNAIKYFPNHSREDSEVKIVVEAQIEDGKKRDVIRVLTGESQKETTMHLDKYYNDYLEGESLNSILNNIAAMVVQIRQADFSMGSINAKNAPSHLFCTVINAEKNQGLLETIPHQRIEDLAIICRWMVSRKNNILSSFVMTQEMMESIGLTEDQMFHLAKQNTKQQLKPTLEVMNGKCENPILFRRPIKLNDSNPSVDNEKVIDLLDANLKITPEVDEESFFILSNESMLNGATSIIFADILKDIGNYLGGDYYILPSSVHEVLIMPAKGQQVQVLKQIITEVNHECVHVKERLSDNVYYYSVAEEKLKMAS